MLELARETSQKIVIEDPRTSTPGPWMLLWVKSVYSDKAAGGLGKAQGPYPDRDARWSEAYDLFTRVKADGAVLYYVAAYHMIEDKNRRYQAAAFSEGTTSRSRLPASSKPPRTRNLARTSSSSWSRRVSRTPFRPQLDDAGIRDLRALPDAFSKLVVLQRPS